MPDRPVLVGGAPRACARAPGSIPATSAVLQRAPAEAEFYCLQQYFAGDLCHQDFPGILCHQEFFPRRFVSIEWHPNPSVHNRSPRSLTYFWVFEPALVSYCEPGRGSEASSVRFPLAPNLDALRSPDRSDARCCAPSDLRFALRFALRKNFAKGNSLFSF